MPGQFSTLIVRTTYVCMYVCSYKYTNFCTIAVDLPCSGSFSDMSSDAPKIITCKATHFIHIMCIRLRRLQIDVYNHVL